MGQWSHSDLSQIANAPPCGFSSGADDIPRPMGCARPNGVNAVVYPGQDGHIHQLESNGNTWVHTDLSILAGTDEPTATSPACCVLPNGVFSVVYGGRHAGNHALQLAGGTATHVDL